jgi:hypothetical protein
MLYLGHNVIRFCLLPQRVLIVLGALLLLALRTSCPPDGEDNTNENERR